MEQANQQTVQRPKISKKTKIAAWWMFFIGVFIILPTLFSFYVFFFGLGAAAPDGNINSLIDGSIGIFVFLMYIISSRLILKIKKVGWKIAILITGACSLLAISFIVTLIIFSVFSLDVDGNILYDSISYLLIPFLLGTPIIFIFLLLDRKEFFKIAS